MSNTPKILVVSREDENMEAAAELLAKKDYDVFSETSTFQAIATLAERKPDIIVLDIDDLELKEMEFFDVVKKINPNVFILISFSFANREKAIKSLERGADCYILKPFYINELLAIVCKFLDRINHKGDILNESIDGQSFIERMALRVAHDINNPLTIISGQLQLLLSEKKDKNSNHSIYASLEEETQRIAESVKNLVTYAQLEEPNKASIDLNDILKKVVCSFKDMKHERDIQIVESFGEDLPMIMADEEQITLVCKNIINSSWKAIAGKSTLKISTESRDGNNVNVIFHDSGREIPPKAIDTIFDPFAVVNEAESGMGLNLCISYNIIKKHGGDLAVSSQDGGGTIFQFTLPVEKHFYFRELLEGQK